MRYKAIDTYEGYEVMVITDSFEEARQACYERIDDTAGECIVGVIDTVLDKCIDIEPVEDYFDE